MQLSSYEESLAYLLNILDEDRKKQTKKFVRLLDGLTAIDHASISPTIVRNTLAALSNAATFFNNLQDTENLDYGSDAQLALEVVIYEIFSGINNEKKISTIIELLSSDFPAECMCRFLQRLSRNSTIKGSSSLTPANFEKLNIEFLDRFADMIRQNKVTDPNALVLSLYTAKNFADYTLATILEMLESTVSGVAAIMLFGSTYTISSTRNVKHRHNIDLEEIASIIDLQSLIKLSNLFQEESLNYKKTTEIFAAFNFAISNRNRFIE